jgi:hypothetical protein
MIVVDERVPSSEAVDHSNLLSRVARVGPVIGGRWASARAIEECWIDGYIIFEVAELLGKNYLLGAVALASAK